MTTDERGRRPLHLAVALDGAGWHPAAWRLAGLAPGSLFTAQHWIGLVRLAERGLLDLVTLEDSLGLQSSRWDGLDDRLDQPRGRLDAVMTAARVAPTTSNIGLVPTAFTTHTEPFHLSKALATLDYVSAGRAGWRAQITARQSDAAHFGRRQMYPGRSGRRDDPEARRAVNELFEEASDYVEVVRRLWDSWEDDAVIRDTDRGRFVDGDKLHYVDFSGPFFSVRGPSITPRPPQGQPVVIALAHGPQAYRFAASAADVVLVTPVDKEDAARISAEVREHERGLGRNRPLLIFADLLVVLEADGRAAEHRWQSLDAFDGAEHRSDARRFSGRPEDLADLMAEWQEAGIEGFRLRPAVLSIDLPAIVEGLVPELQRRQAFRQAYESSTLRGHLGLARPDNRYSSTDATPAGVSVPDLSSDRVSVGGGGDR
ncbi:MAG: LLM class flavin-dependent oxidoreductase [Acidimicrobiales bacterium]|jgi:alkanesulfonate monooxygenase SsuD/methylene tetrahydromethanopterin reductase-like flavin-dependent oxidoreductase (luciferase family)